MSVIVNGETLVLDRSGAAWWPRAATLIVADLHFEKGSSYARGGQLLPPYDSRATLLKLAEAVGRHRPATIVALGDSFHDGHAGERIGAQERAMLEALAKVAPFVWIAGNHDPAPPAWLGGTVASEVALGGLFFCHEPGVFARPGEIAGHLHPKARVPTRGRSVERRCFASDGERAVMPAFGAYAGGLSIRDRAFQKVFQSLEFVAHVLGDNRVHAFAASRCY